MSTFACGRRAATSLQHIYNRPRSILRLQPLARKSYTSFPVQRPSQIVQRAFVKGISRRYSTVVVQNTGRSSTRRIISFLLLSTSSFLIGGYFSLVYAPPLVTTFVLGAAPTNEDSLKYEAPDEFTKQIDDHIRNSALAQSLRNNPDFVESRPAVKLPSEIRQHNLTGGTLAGPSMIAVPPLYFNEKGGKSMVAIFYLGPDLSGHPGIIHGGMLSTMMDEGLCRCVFPALPNKVGFTANLTVNYRSPTKAGQCLVLRAKTTKVEGRKGWAEGWIEPLDVPEGEQPKKLVEASVLAIEPKHAGLLKSLYRAVT